MAPEVRKKDTNNNGTRIVLALVTTIIIIPIVLITLVIIKQSDFVGWRCSSFRVCCACFRAVKEQEDERNPREK